jgi:tRNA (uracil-5-)-methyltransferase TRM9
VHKPFLDIPREGPGRIALIRVCYGSLAVSSQTWRAIPMSALTQSYEPEPGGGGAPVGTLRESYDRYYATGLYTRRYPRPNRHVLRLIRGALGPEGGRVLDFGCGCGRYAVPLARQPGVSVFAYDISPVAVHELGRRRHEAERSCGPPMRLESLSGSLEDLTTRLEGDPGFDLVMLLFGVLGHIAGRARRLRLLRSLRARLRPGGCLIASVPNRVRRFRPEQRAPSRPCAQDAWEAGDICYERRSGDVAIALYYHLFSPAEFLDDLAEAGFVVARLLPESVLSERAVVSSPLCGAVDALLRRVAPLSLAYGFVAVARPALVRAV